MPTYEYLCDNCGQTMEIFQSITESPRKKCPQCGKQKLKRLLGTGAGVIFKGSGFYQTDYRSESYKKASEKDSPKPKSEKSAGSASSESKSAGKTAAASNQ
ncbi:MAG TPA: zinc ribbon domain-containing protein [Anaerohalosphaeraceae bacterium]|nr:zinc ribbon domain-containing protein [Anaerohalosphaeraceae bacterium]HOL89428.1 zinc ribbon domain-containing protein [Anaerohalosphaeraceae bacterium]HPP55624.1 zinc ribbon domain-containing protein [Anaerohalosphaeraceae bacterium]